jgi:putative endonuclease
MGFHTYVLYSATFGKIYIGYTSDLQARLQSHNELATKGWTIRFRPWVLIHSESFETKAEALKREKELKSASGRKFIWEKINNKGHFIHLDMFTLASTLHETS